MKMVIVEDDAACREILAAVVARKFKEIEVFTAGNGREGLEVFNQQMPELLLTDVKMPEMNGVQLAQKVRALAPGTMIIVISADSGEASLADSLREGLVIDHFIRKPVDYGKLFGAIEASLLKLQ